MTKRVVIVGGHGNVALRLARLIGPSNDVTSIIRSQEHEADITSASAKPLLLSLEDAKVSDFTKVFQDKDVVYFSAGAGGKGGPERTKKVDYEGALKVFDAIEGVQGDKPRLILVSAMDVRDPEKVPEWYDEADLKMSARVRGVIATYMKWKYEADKNLVERTAFAWTILRPGGLSNEPGTGKADIGRTHLTRTISRDDVAKTLALLLDRPDAAGLALDLVGGETPLADGLDAVVRNKVTAWIG
ncbi:NAD(P)-binding protein [Heliocybe sulcata]|uniref:NAD(P)-binding protein n=1 Tax=Heliocybe sulcata TaxID=5364 RepID=A0A5C3MTC2_9AGAM|nr:NAD(P)-binding protein [Heliocybe sulcata]